MRLSEYENRFESISLEREEGILVLRVHTEQGPMVWSRAVHADLAECFACVAGDAENEVVIITGTGDSFSGPAVVEEGEARRAMGRQSARDWAGVFDEGRRLIHGLLDIPVPVIGAVNGPAYRHPEIPLLSDIVLASRDVVIQDATHFRGGLVPGDGVHVAFPLLLGPTRGRYFLLTGQAIAADEAERFGLVNEVLDRDQLMPRARELARQIARQSRPVRRYARLLLTDELKTRMNKLLGYGLALEGLAVLDSDGDEKG